jgi:hypothetical protein
MTSSLAALYSLRHADNPVVFFDISIGGFPAGRIKMELFADVVPRVRTVTKTIFYYRQQRISGSYAPASSG